MYYTIENTIGTEVTADGTKFVCGNCYATKTKAPKDAEYLLAFSKAENPIDGLIWRFDGKADVDFEEFVEEVDPEERDILAWKSERINIQAKIRPSKDSKKAIAQTARVDKFARLNQELLDGIITVEQFAEKTRLIVSQM